MNLCEIDDRGIFNESTHNMISICVEMIKDNRKLEE